MAEPTLLMEVSYSFWYSMLIPNNFTYTYYTRMISSIINNTLPSVWVV